MEGTGDDLVFVYFFIFFGRGETKGSGNDDLSRPKREIFDR